jgi:hypothetical protein
MKQSEPYQPKKYWTDYTLPQCKFDAAIRGFSVWELNYYKH